MPKKDAKLISLKDLQGKSDMLWFVVGGYIVDATGYEQEHPGGPELLEDVKFCDATKAFSDIGHSGAAEQELDRHVIGLMSPGDLAKLPKK